MEQGGPPRSIVVNFNSPELQRLAGALAAREALAAYVRPYVNKGRAWERMLAALPLAGAAYANTFGRRTVGDARLAAKTIEAGVAADLCAAAVTRVRWLAAERRHRAANELYKSVRESVAAAAARRIADADAVVAYEGFALPAFDAARALGGKALLLNYPVAHHRHRRRVRLEENEREPAFAATWPDFDDWPAGHEERLDAEIDRADAVLVGSTYAADTFVGEGVERARMRVVPYGVDLDTFRERAAPPRGRPFEVVFAGQLTQRKGLSYLLRGYERFARADTRLVLVGNVVGSDAPLRPYSRLVEHVPHLTRPALAERLRGAQAFVLPTLIEGMPLVVLEAMACGLPVVVTGNGPGDVVRDGVDGFIVPERDADAIGDRLDRLYREPGLAVEMGRRAAERARQFGWSAYAEKALRVLRDVASRERAVRVEACAA